MTRAYGWTPHPDPHACRVCGWDHGEPPWDRYGSPLYFICDCCGSESGPDDDPAQQAEASLLRWIARGAPWFDPSERPEGWSITRHLAVFGLEVHRRDLRRHRPSN